MHRIGGVATGGSFPDRRGNDSSSAGLLGNAQTFPPKFVVFETYTSRRGLS